MEAYYYSLMDKQAQAAYYAMLTGMRELSPSFSVPRLEREELSKIFMSLRLDHPEIFYSVSFKYRYDVRGDHVIFMPEYMFEKKKIIEHQKALKVRADRVIGQAKGMNDWEKIRYVHDFICTGVQYDKLKKPYSHEIIGPLQHGIGVCEGIAKTVKFLCDALNVQCVIAICGNNPEKGIRYRHTWNIVRLDGRYYHLDATFDNTLGKPAQIRYDYFLLSDQQIARDHEPMLYPMMKCEDSNRFYYKEKKLSFTKLEEVQKRMMQCAKKGKTMELHWRGGSLNRRTLLELVHIIEEEAVKRQRHVRLSVNWAQAVIHVEFSQELPEEQLIDQQAAEDEAYTEI